MLYDYHRLMPLNLFNSISSLYHPERGRTKCELSSILWLWDLSQIYSHMIFFQRHYDNDFYREQDCRQYRISGRSLTIEPSIFHSPWYKFFLRSPHCLLFDYIDSSWFSFVNSFKRWRKQINIGMRSIAQQLIQ